MGCVKKKKRKNWGLLNKETFALLEKEKTEFLRSLTIDESVKILESLTGEETLNEFIHNFSDDTPMCLKIGLKKWHRYRKYSIG